MEMRESDGADGDSNNHRDYEKCSLSGALTACPVRRSVFAHTLLDASPLFFLMRKLGLE